MQWDCILPDTGESGVLAAQPAEKFLDKQISILHCMSMLETSDNDIWKTGPEPVQQK